MKDETKDNLVTLFGGIISIPLLILAIGCVFEWASIFAFFLMLGKICLALIILFFLIASIVLVISAIIDLFFRKKNDEK